MGSRWRSVWAAAPATEAVSFWRSQSPHTSMAGTLRSTTNGSLRKLRRARVGDFRFLEDYQDLGPDHFDRIDVNRIRRTLVRRRNVWGTESPSNP